MKRTELSLPCKWCTIITLSKLFHDQHESNRLVSLPLVLDSIPTVHIRTQGGNFTLVMNY